MFYVYLADINISFITMPKLIQDYHHNVKQFGFWSGLRCRAWSGFKQLLLKGVTACLTVHVKTNLLIIPWDKVRIQVFVILLVLLNLFWRS